MPITRLEFQELLRQHGIIYSMSGKVQISKLFAGTHEKLLLLKFGTEI